MAAAQANKNAFIVFHLAGLAECENNMMPGYAWYKDADRHDGSSLTGPYAPFSRQESITIQSALQKRRDVSGAPTNVRQRGMKGQAIQIAACEAGHTRNLSPGLDTCSPVASTGALNARQGRHPMKRIPTPTFIKRIVFPTLAVMVAAIIVLRAHAVQIVGAPKLSAAMSIQEVREKADLKKLPVEEFEDQSLVFPTSPRH